MHREFPSHMEKHPKPSFKPLEYWVPPPKVIRHIRGKSSAVFLAGSGFAPIRNTFTHQHEDIEKNSPDMSYGGRASNITRKPVGGNNMPMSPQGAPPAYALDKEGTLKPHWWDVKQWGWKKWAALAAGIIVIIVIGVVAGIESAKLNAYPDYSKLTYTLEDTYSGTDFFDNFDYYTGYDPSSGFVHYVDAISANTTYNLTYATSTSAVLKVDTSVSNTSNPNASTGRFSVRVTSKKSYDTGLFIFDVIHTPIGCATWPALWLSDVDNWPTNGEIDVMEAVNVVADSENQMTLHTTDGCEMKSKRKERGAVLSTNCLNSTNDNAGCGVTAPAQTFGTTYNNNGGGIVAMELRSAGIRMWQFTRSNVPADIAAGSPDPSTWSEATADFPSTHCDIDTHFKNQSIIMNIDLCGSWAGTASIYNENCPGVCDTYVANNNTAFAESYWEFGAFQIYSSS